MNLKLIRLFLISVSSVICMQVSAQENYQAEIGVLAGGSYYLGDANNLLFYNMQPSYGVLFRYRYNQRVAIRAELSISNIGDIKYNYSNSINSADFCAEFNFFDLERNENRMYSKIFSPYIFAGVGFMTDLFDKQGLPEPSLPFGLGIKVKISKRWNVNLQWSNKILLNSDYMENNPGLNNKSGINGTNIFNNDLLSTLTFGISFDFWKKQCECKMYQY